ncbi:RNA 2',3'-cyclic phosphodiesterase [Dyella monticola]|uniref:RNA 2',3'-cyclic phosphodiesterase n=1 Tax=Dyella monticola TaxID=1927958 RepID=A0A370X9L4_9GAMM|nr:RNA 2',3'-cyclic phosphodiesterase [Dyella monticola]RDS84960.1 RNA 2',3'-cyclic phosphodiesterase [Dyella monticola]
MNSSRPTSAQAERCGHRLLAPAETHRLFFALMPDTDTRRAMEHAATHVQQQQSGLRARWVRPERFHATLIFLGDYPAVPDELVENAMAAAGYVSAAPFAWTLDYVASFRGREPPCVLRSAQVAEALILLWRTLQESLTQSGLHLRRERQFTPHVTLAYARCELAEAIAVAPPIVWPVDRFVLIHNVVGKGNYQVLGNWKLSGES